MSYERKKTIVLRYIGGGNWRAFLYSGKLKRAQSGKPISFDTYDEPSIGSILTKLEDVDRAANP